MDERDVDAEFEAIIAGWDALPSADDVLAPPEDPVEPDPVGPDPVGPDPVGPDPVGPDPARLPAPPGEGVWRAHPSLLGAGDAEPGDAATAASAEGSDEDARGEHYVPEPVSLPPQEDLHFWGIVIGLVAGPLLLLWLILVGGGTSAGWWLFLAVSLTVGGFGLLILRQPTRRDPDDPDDGARL